MKMSFYRNKRRSRVHAKLLEIGLTLPGFVHRSQVIASLPSLGLLTLAA